MEVAPGHRHCSLTESPEGTSAELEKVPSVWGNRRLAAGLGVEEGLDLVRWPERREGQC